MVFPPPSPTLRLLQVNTFFVLFFFRHHLCPRSSRTQSRSIVPAIVKSCFEKSEKCSSEPNAPTQLVWILSPCLTSTYTHTHTNTHTYTHKQKHTNTHTIQVRGHTQTHARNPFGHVHINADNHTQPHTPFRYFGEGKLPTTFNACDKDLKKAAGVDVFTLHGCIGCHKHVYGPDDVRQHCPRCGYERCDANTGKPHEVCRLFFFLTMTDIIEHIMHICKLFTKHT